MKNILKAALAAAVACVSAAVMTLCVSAETEDFESPLNKVKSTSGAWEQSLTLDKNDFDCGRITPDTVVQVEFELDGEPSNPNIAPVELILFNYTTADPQIWAKIEPYEYDNTYAYFDYETMIKVYGTDDLSTVDNLCIGDTGTPLTVTKLTITNCTVVEVTTTTETTTAEVIEITDPPATEATTAATTAAPEKEEGGGIPIIPIVIATVVVAVIVVVVIIVIRSKRRFY